MRNSAFQDIYCCVLCFVQLDLSVKDDCMFFLSSNEDVDEGFVIDQEGIGLRLTAMKYWKCSEMGIALPSVDKKEPDCKFVIAESLPEQGNNSRSHLSRRFPSAMFCDIKIPASLCACTFRQKSGRHLLGEAQSCRDPAHRAVHKKHHLYGAYDG